MGNETDLYKLNLWDIQPVSTVVITPPDRILSPWRAIPKAADQEMLQF